MSIGRAIENKRLEKALKPLVKGLLKEGSESTQYLFNTVDRKLKRRLLEESGEFGDYEHRAKKYYMHTMGELVNKATVSTSTYKEARLKLFTLIDQIILEHQEK